MCKLGFISLRLVVLVIAMLILSTVNALGATPFVLPVSYAGGGPIAIGDLNDDGQLDVVVGDGAVGPGNGVYVRMGNGDGTLGPATHYRTGGDAVCAIAIADVNGDGKPDILVEDCYFNLSVQNWNGVVGILLGNGDGTFQPVYVYWTEGDCASSMAVADVNGDGKSDIVVANWGPKGTGCNGNVQNGNVGVLLGNGDGTFKPAVTYDSGGWAADAVALGDLNGDGKVDVVVGDANSKGFGVMLGNGDGTFKPVVTSFPGIDFCGSAVALADMNRDRKLDLVLGGCAGNLWVLFGNGNGTFQYPKQYASGGDYVSQIAIADVNSDGMLDVAVASQWYGSKGVAGVLLNKGDGTLLPVRKFYPGVASRYVALGDLTGDGRPELLASGLYNKMIAYLNNSAPWSKLMSLTSSGSPSYIGQPVTFAANLCNAGCVPDGEPVMFYDGTNLIGKATTLNGVATLTVSSLRVGAHALKSIYPGDASWKPSSGTFKQTVVKYPTRSTLTSNKNPSNYGDAVTFTATVTSSGGPTPTGRVTFKDGTINLHTVQLTGGVATLTASKLAVGTHAITVHYLGDGYNSTNTSAILNQVVQ